MQILSVERRRLTITLMYGIITAEKELLRSWIFDFLMASSSHRNGLDHSFDHLQSWTTWKQCEREHLKASFLDSKAPKSLVNQEKNRCRFVWDVDAAGSNPVTPTISSVHNTSELWTLDFFLLLFTFSLIFSFFEQVFCSFLFFFLLLFLFFYLSYIAVGRYSIATPCLESSLYVCFGITLGRSIHPTKR